MNVQSLASHGLSDDEVAHYHEHGYVIPRWRLPADRLERMRADLDTLLASNAAVGSDSMFCPHITGGGTQGLKGSNIWLEHASIPEILDSVGQLAGSDFLLWGTTVFGKPAGTGKRVPWHQDGEYWPIRPLATCSAWIALDDATPENGCLRVIPGSHKQRRLRAHTRKDSPDLVLNQELNAEEFNEADAVDIVLEAGQISLHDVYLVHGSEPNRSDKRRAGYVCRYMPTTSHFDHAYGAELQKRSGQVDFANRALWLMRGRDVCGLNDFQIGH
ncbi:MAG: phytanoyl-CoA dioxygenase family protein [Alphaproteobacteria bacterium]|nr:phytanoyl-CoA dioxygenase family protein [Alphaproteobacteria bacterium]